LRAAAYKDPGELGAVRRSDGRKRVSGGVGGQRRWLLTGKRRIGTTCGEYLLAAPLTLGEQRLVDCSLIALLHPADQAGRLVPAIPSQKAIVVGVGKRPDLS